jgi:hypothetical protein
MFFPSGAGLKVRRDCNCVSIVFGRNIPSAASEHQQSSESDNSKNNRPIAPLRFLLRLRRFFLLRLAMAWFFTSRIRMTVG